MQRYYITHNKPLKTTFSNLLQPPAWKQNGTISKQGESNKVNK